ncbi:hypothetical protein BDZ45DRAFT_409746 [Acephala macrosclerotiorum]|nr:hypothetical protein BDZ45DRAFT_409746 [Acephala macrosclerotiorum]
MLMMMLKLSRVQSLGFELEAPRIGNWYPLSLEDRRLPRGIDDTILLLLALPSLGTAHIEAPFPSTESRSDIEETIKIQLTCQ